MSKPKRKKKKNKYQQFSKVDPDALDPEERMILEAQQKQQEQSATTAAASQQKATRHHQQQQQQQPPMQFPNPTAVANGLLDPYDPTTFGYIRQGTVVGAHGVHGWVKVRVESDFFADMLLMKKTVKDTTDGVVVHVQLPHKRAPRAMVVQQGKSILQSSSSSSGSSKKEEKKKQKRQPQTTDSTGSSSSGSSENYCLIQFQGITDRDAALAFRGANVYIRQEQRELQLQQEQQQQHDGDQQQQQGDDDEKEEDDYYMISDLVGLDVFLLPTNPTQLERLVQRLTKLNQEEDELAETQPPEPSTEKNASGGGGSSSSSENKTAPPPQPPQDNDDDNNDDDSLLLFVGTVHGVVLAQDISSSAMPAAVGHDFLELLLPRGNVPGVASYKDELVLIPLVPELVPVIDLLGTTTTRSNSGGSSSNSSNSDNDCRGAIYIDPPAGLLDLTYVRPDKTRIKGFLPATTTNNGP